MRAASRQLKPDKLLFILAATPPHKKLASDSPNNDDRKALLTIAAQDVPEAEISDIELNRREKLHRRYGV